MCDRPKPEVRQMKKTYVADLAVGGRVDELFVLVSRTLRDYAKGQYLTMVLGDRTGTVNAVLWDEAESTFKSYKPGDLVRVSGPVGDYRGDPQIRVDRMGLTDRRTADLSDFIETLANAAEVEAQLRTILATVSDPWLVKLIAAHLTDEPFMDRFRSATAAKSWHHAFHGGLLKHTTELVELAALVAPLFPEVNRDLVVTCAFLHDLGKIHEMQAELNIEYTTIGRLVGHIVIGNQMALDRMREIPEFPAALQLQIQHLILSHQGELNYSSPVTPKSLDAMLLHKLDDLNAQLNGMRKVIQQTRESGQEWSDWVRPLERQLWTGGPAER